MTPGLRRARMNNWLRFSMALSSLAAGSERAPNPRLKKKLNNNLILRKLKIALNLQSQDIIGTLDAAGLSISEHELSAFFRKPGHPHYRECKDQVLRNFLEGLRLKYRTNG